MKFNFKIQQYQTDAVDAVVNVFAGQPYSSGVSYIRDTGTLNQKPQQLSFLPFADNPEQMELEDLLRDSGYKNEAVALSDDQLLQNIHTLQSQNNIKLSPELVNDIQKRKRRSIASFSNRFQYYSSTENSSPSIDSTSSIGIFAPSCMVIRRSKSSIFLTAPTADTYFPPAFRSSGWK